jgi:uncharacterized protein (TIGR02284 family)
MAFYVSKTHQETIMGNSAATLNELIEITRDGQTFYTEAVAKVRSPLLKAVFHGIIDAKTQLIKSLSEHVRVRGEQPSNDGTLLGNFRNMYADIRARFSNSKDSAYVVELEESEDRLLDAFEGAATVSGDPEVRGIILRHLPKVRLCHEQMRNLKLSMAA